MVAEPDPETGRPSGGAGGRVRLVVLFGGRSAEREVSCVTAASVLAAVDRSRYDVVPIGIDQAGTWVRAKEAAKRLTAAGPTVDPFAVVRGERTVVFPLLHGPLGEDGTVQGLLELADVPYVGCGVLSSALAMDKATAKEVLAQAGIPQARWLAVRDGAIHGGVADDTSGATLADRIEAELGWPVFVKPANMGSSIGVTKVAGRLELGDAITLALAYDEWLVIEEAIVGREVECAVLGNLHPQASVMGEIVPSHEFYDYDDKYSGEGAELHVPADLPLDVASEARSLALRAYAALRCDGMARVDLFYDEGGRGLLVNELNTIPGFTPFSMYPQLWGATGMPYPELIDRLVDLALERHRRREGRTGRARA
jgi:D-alanine-D-alanine ligase